MNGALPERGWLWLDWPPVWTAAGVVLAWAASWLMPWRILGVPGRVLGVALALTGLGLMLAAVLEMTKARTTVVPRRQPAALVTSGVFEWSRNPIYLGDLLIAAGAVLWLQVPWLLPMLGVLAWVLRTRFIDGEEQRLTESFGAEFTLWAARTGRWFGRKPV
ncbi:MAG: isoprenylcysteine carboxylmethyltransferase family protein [Paracoccaceae bacterium]|jgi:protein-S-isoprenylcysteine O-methyltransferase Ste14|nr:isoprenylcysteine carboxylmethyltransferase family protein [Rhodobacter sp.]